MWERDQSRARFNGPNPARDLSSAIECSALPEILDLTTLYRSQWRPMSSWLRRFGVAGQDVDDLRHDIFVAVLERKALFSNESAVTTWLFSVCRNRAATHRRRQAITHEAPLEVIEAMMPVDDSYEAKWRENAVRQAVSRMRPRYRLVLELLDLKERDYEEVARHLGMRVKAVRVLLHRARKELVLEARRALGGKLSVESHYYHRLVE